MPTTLSPYQLNVIRTSLRDYGELPLAAHAAGLTVSVLRREIARDDQLAEEVDHLLSLHASAIVVVAQKRALTSDVILSKLLEAKAPGFARETRDKKKDDTKPAVLVLREFNDEGQDVTDVKPKEPTGPLLIGMDQLL